jgi:hypothetical protein
VPKRKNPPHMLCKESGGKAKYRDKIAAMNHLSRLQHGGVDMTNVYRCPHCGSWHLTSKRKGRKR